MNKKKFMTLLLAAVVGMNSSIASAKDYSCTVIVDGSYYQASGRCTSNSFYASSSWWKTDEGAKVYITYQTYTVSAEGKTVEAEFGATTPTVENNSVSKTVSFYRITQVEFVHFAKTEEYVKAALGPVYVTP